MGRSQGKPTGGLAPRRRNATAKGRRIQALAKEILEAKGYLVEMARPKVVWIKGPSGVLQPISTSHDLFGVWDGVAVKMPGWVNLNNDPVPEEVALGLKDGVFFQPSYRFFFQVTILANVSDRRRKILSSNFPCGELDVILGYKQGRDRHFRVYRGPDFATWDGECWRPVSKGGPGATAEGREP